MAVEILVGDALEKLRELPDESVHCCVTSPPYWGLRDYGVDGQIGLEETPDEWCAQLVEVFREVKRVLRADGTCWVNVGDRYASSGYRGGQRDRDLINGVSSWGPRECSTSTSAGIGDLKPKDLIGQPWMLAFALRADGWYLRDAIVWNKPNPMPESVKDRCTNAYEHVFLLAKSKRYFFDSEAIMEVGTNRAPNNKTHAKGVTAFINGDEKMRTRAGLSDIVASITRNCRNVWTIATEPFAEAHFATFPTELARRCILAGTSTKGVCGDCKAPWERVTEQEPSPFSTFAKGERNKGGRTDGFTTPKGGASEWAQYKRPITTGWQPSCKCDAEIAQATVLDPFGGAGTTGLVADRLQRNATLIELNAEYAEMARRRIDSDRGDLLEIMQQPKPEQGQLCLTP